MFESNATYLFDFKQSGIDLLEGSDFYNYDCFMRNLLIRYQNLLDGPWKTEVLDLLHFWHRPFDSL